MVEITEKHTEDQPYFKPVMHSEEQRDLSKLKKRIMSARDFVFCVGLKYPDLELWNTENISIFVSKIKENGCTLPDWTITRAIRLAKEQLRSIGLYVDDDRADTMEKDHSIVYGEIKE